MTSAGAQLDALQELWANHGYDALEAEQKLSEIERNSAHNFGEYYRTVSEYAYAENYAISYLIRGYGTTLDESIPDWNIVLQHEAKSDKYNNMTENQKKKYNEEDKAQGWPEKNHLMAEKKRVKKIIGRAYKQYTRVKKILFGPESTWGKIVILEDFHDLSRLPVEMLRHRRQHRTFEEKTATNQKKKDNAMAKKATLLSLGNNEENDDETTSSEATTLDDEDIVDHPVDTATYTPPTVDTTTYTAPTVDTDTYTAPTVDTDTYTAPTVDTDTSVLPPFDQLYSQPSSQVDTQMDDNTITTTPEYIDWTDIVTCRKRKVVDLRMFSDVHYNSILEFINNLK
jgi:hypothetical protein